MYHLCNKSLKLLSVFLFPVLSFAAQPERTFHSDPVSEPRNVTYCELAKAPSLFDHALIRVSAFVTHGFENFHLTDPSCARPPENFSIWIMYGGRTLSDTAYCCPGETGSDIRADALSVEGVRIPLVADTTYQRFKNLLEAEPDTTVRATLVGRFFQGEKQRFGHMGCCSLFV